MEGRFITRDTYAGEDEDTLSLHLYTYCENDGVNNFDPSGHRKTTKFEKKEIKRLKKNAPKYKLEQWNDGNENDTVVSVYGSPYRKWKFPDKVQYQTNCYAYAFN